MYLVRKAVKEYFKKHNKRISKEVFEMMNHKIEYVLDQYIKILNHHKTLTTKEVASFDIHLRMIL
jgi:DNA-binding protein Fis